MNEDSSSTSENTASISLKDYLVIMVASALVSASMTVMVVRHLDRDTEQMVRVVEYSRIIDAERTRLENNPNAVVNAEAIQNKLVQFSQKLAQRGYIVVSDENLLAYPPYMAVDYENGEFTTRVK